MFLSKFEKIPNSHIISFLHNILKIMSLSTVGMKKKMVHKRFTEEEDNKLRDLVQKYGENQWLMISSRMGTRNSRQCKDRWLQYLSPKSNLTPWTPEEEELLLKLSEQYKGKWLEITKMFPGRSYNQVKNKWKTLERRKKAAEINSYNIPLKSLLMQNKLYFINNILPVIESLNTQNIPIKENDSDIFSQDEVDFDLFDDPMF